MKLHLGCNDDLKPGYLNVDCAPPADLIVDLSGGPLQRAGMTFDGEDLIYDPKPWPWEDSSVDEILANDVFEHLPSKIFTLNECWRVLKPGGRLRFQVPCVFNVTRIQLPVPYASPTIHEVNPGAFADPTHRSFWTLDDRYYYGEEWADPKTGERGRLGPAYGIKALFRGKWKHVHYGTGLERRSKVVADLEAVK